MNTKYLEKNLSLLDLVEPTFENMKQIHEKSPKIFNSAFIYLVKRYTKCKDDIKKANEMFINTLNKEEFDYCIENLDSFIKKAKENLFL